MRKLLVAAMTAGLLMIGGSAMADVAGTGEGSSADGKGNNDVDCNKSGSSPAQRHQVPQTGVFVIADGNSAAPQNGGAIVLCNEGGGTAPSVIEGRIIVAGGTGGGWVAADGDKNNAEQGRGWARVNIGSSPNVRCGGPNDAGTSNNSETNNGTQAACG